MRLSTPQIRMLAALQDGQHPVTGRESRVAGILVRLGLATPAPAYTVTPQGSEILRAQETR